MSLIKSTQEQAVASWVSYLNQLRMNLFLENIFAEDMKLEQSLNELQKLKNFIQTPEHILGNEFTKHGEIAENMQVRISNAENFMKGLKPEYSFDGIGRTAPEDYLKGFSKIQSKFYSGDDGRRSLNAVLEHLKKYPDFIKNGGQYEIPKDQHEQLVKLLKIKPSEMTNKQINILKVIRKFEQQEGVCFEKTINPTVINYSESQIETAGSVIKKEESKLKEQSQKNRDYAYTQSKTTISEGVKIVGVSGALEGGVSLLMAIHQKRKLGKKLSEFTEIDWKEVGFDTGKGAIKGGVRGGAVYGLTNFTATPASVATSFVTASYGIIALAIKKHRGEISTEEFIEQSEIVCLDVSISAVTSLIGQVAIPIPVLGAIIGNTCGMFMYGIAKEYLDEYEQLILKSYKNDLNLLNIKLDLHYENLLKQLREEFAKFSSIVELAFDTDVNIAFQSSVELSYYVGVNESNILKHIEDIDNFFLK